MLLCVTAGLSAPGVICGSGTVWSRAIAGSVRPHRIANTSTSLIAVSCDRTGRACREATPRRSRGKRRTGPSERPDLAQFVHHGRVSNCSYPRKAKLREEGEVDSALPVVGPGHAVEQNVRVGLVEPIREEAMAVLTGIAERSDNPGSREFIFRVLREGGAQHRALGQRNGLGKLRRIR